MWLRLMGVLVLIITPLVGCTVRRTLEGGVEPGWWAPANPASAPALPTAVYEGRLVDGFETSSFEACGLNERWWAEGNLHRVGDFVCAHPEVRSDKGFQLAILFVRVRGTPSATGNYGHGGSYPRKLAVDEVLEVREYLDGDCGRRPGA